MAPKRKNKAAVQARDLSQSPNKSAVLRELAVRVVIAAKMENASAQNALLLTSLSAARTRLAATLNFAAKMATALAINVKSRTCFSAARIRLAVRKLLVVW